MNQYLCVLTAIGFFQCTLLVADERPAAKQSTPRDPAEISRDQTALVRLTVQQSYWDTAGGPGTVVYYGPSRALVIRGNWRIHEAVADMLSALR